MVENTYNPNFWEVKVGDSGPAWATIDTFSKQQKLSII